jgi:hypothetical protein
VRREHASVVAVADRDRTDPLNPRELHCPIHRPLAHDYAESVIAVEERGGTSFADDSDDRGRVDDPAPEGAHIGWKPRDAVRLNPAELRVHERIRKQRHVGLGNAPVTSGLGHKRP